MKIFSITRFDQNFYNERDDFTYIGDGEFGGKAQGLAFIRKKIISHFQPDDPAWKGITVNIPRLVVITTNFFDLFMKLNKLYDIALSNLSDERIAHYFLKADLPVTLIGDLRALIDRIHLPLAVRSSSLLEDSLRIPLAGIYETKMIPNNDLDVDTRFHKLTEAIKFVYASTFFQASKSYLKATRHRIEDEKMAVIIQEVVGLPHNKRFYPNISGVVRSYNFYPTGHAKPEDGVVNLALGLGKTIVDGGIGWTYCPEYPGVSPPYNSVKDLIKQTQRDFWAVNIDKPSVYDPVKETEYLVKLEFNDADYDNTLQYVASTYDHASDRINIGVGSDGPRIINFAPILQVDLFPLNRLIKSVLRLCKETFNTDVEIEFAVSIEHVVKDPTHLRFGFLQVRPMKISNESVAIDLNMLEPRTILAASDNVMGNGCVEDIMDIIYVEPETFDFKYSRQIATEIETLNRQLIEQRAPYLLIGFGRWGSSDPWLGIPVNWGQIAGSRVIVESQLKESSIDFSQGSHFFHNISNLGILYFSMKANSPFPIDWNWLNQQETHYRGCFIKQLRLKSPLTIKVDGRKRMGVIIK